MRKLLLATFISTLNILFTAPSFAQAPDWMWAKSMGTIYTDYCNAVTTDDSGNVYFTGGFSWSQDFDPGPNVFMLFAYAGEDIFVAKFNSQGDFVWAKQMGQLGNDFGTGIAVDDSGNVYTTGIFMYTVDFDPDLGPGTYNLTAAGSNEIFVQKLDNNGNFVWAGAIGGSGNDMSFDIDVDGANNVYVTGEFSGLADLDPTVDTLNFSSGGYNDIFISKLDAQGNLAWARHMPGTEYGIGHAIDFDTQNNIYVTGSFSQTVDFDPGPGQVNLSASGNYDGFVFRLDTAGNLTWAKAIGGSSYEESYDIAVDNAGSVYLAGFFWSTADFDPGANVVNLTSFGASDAFILKLEGSGNFMWAKQLGGTNYDQARSIDVDAPGNVYTTGSFSSTADFDPAVGTFNLTAAGSADVFVSELNGAGDFLFAKALGGEFDDVGLSVSVSSLGNAHVGGYYYSTSVPVVTTSSTIYLTNADTGTTNDIFLVKLDMSIATALGEAVNAGNISIYPNPASETVMIESNSEADIQLQIFDYSGRKIEERVLHKKIFIDVMSFPAGLYFLRLDNGKETISEKIMVQH
jgi:hypothetical protein